MVVSFRWPTWAVGDVIGCGYIPEKQTIFFTRNGSWLGNAFESVNDRYLAPVIGFAKYSPNYKVQLNFGEKAFLFNDPTFVFTPTKKQNKNCAQIPDRYWLHFLNSEVMATRMLVSRMLVSSIDTCTDNPLVEKCKIWLSSPLFSNGMMDLSCRAVNEEKGYALLVALANVADRDEDCKKLIKIMQQGVKVHKSEASVHINQAVYAVCACLIWHNGLTAEVVALVEGRREKPSKSLLDAWQAGGKMQIFFSRGQLQLSTATQDDIAESGVVVPCPGAPDEVVRMAIENVGNRAKALLRTPPSVDSSSSESVRKKIWQAAAKLVTLKDSARNFSRVTTHKKTENWLHGTISFRADITHKAAVNKTPTLSESILNYVQLGPDPLMLFGNVPN